MHHAGSCSVLLCGLSVANAGTTVPTVYLPYSISQVAQVAERLRISSNFLFVVRIIGQWRQHVSNIWRWWPWSIRAVIPQVGLQATESRGFVHWFTNAVGRNRAAETQKENSFIEETIEIRDSVQSRHSAQGPWLPWSLMDSVASCPFFVPRLNFRSGKATFQKGTHQNISRTRTPTVTRWPIRFSFELSIWPKVLL